jgi:hypothetical protein
MAQDRVQERDFVLHNKLTIAQPAKNLPTFLGTLSLTCTKSTPLDTSQIHPVHTNSSCFFNWYLVSCCGSFSIFLLFI